MKIAVLGAGMVGRTMAIDLCQHHDVTSFDISHEALDVLRTKQPGIKTSVADLGDYGSYAALLAEFSFVILAVPGFMGYKALEAVIMAGKDVADISFFPEDSLALDTLAKQQGVTAIVDCGVAPGMSNYVLGYHNAHMQITAFECTVGGLPKRRVKPYEYKAPFSPIDVIEEYTRPARLMENGQIVTRPALSDAELVDFEEVGTLESFNTDGLRSLLFTMSHIPDMKERTLRYPGHIDLIKALMKGGMFDTEKIMVNGVAISPLEFTSAALVKQWKLGPEEPEFTLMKIKVSGTLNGQPHTVAYTLYDEYDAATATSSMSRTTGYTCTASLHLVMNGLFTEKGVFPPELVGGHGNCFDFVMGYLKERGVVYRAN